MGRQDGDLKLTRAGEFPPVLSVERAARLLQVPEATGSDRSARGRLRGCGRNVGEHPRLFRDRSIVRAFNEGL
jgi:hypothetical protein